MIALVQLGDYFGTLVFAITGGLAAAEKRLDLGGFILLAFVTGVGGGTMRDLILQREGVFWLDEPMYITLCVVGAILTFVFGAKVGRLNRTLVWSDALGLAVFAVIGATIATQLGERPVTAVLMGVLTATGGGVIREMIRNELPILLHREVYMVAAAAGSTALVILHAAGMPPPVSMAAGGCVAFGLRAWGIVREVHLPVYGGPGRAEGAPPEAAERGSP